MSATPPRDIGPGVSPLVSVITVVKNGAAGIERTIRSVVGQSYPKVEYLVIDGGSRDGTLEIVERYRTRIDHVVSEADRGIYDAMNKGIELARGEWLLFLGADDALADGDVLRDLFGRGDRAPCAMICGIAQYDGGRRMESRLSWRTRVYNTIQHQAAFYRRCLFADFRFRTDLQAAADYELNYLIYLRRVPVLFLDRLVAVCGERGISHAMHPLDAYLELYRARSRHTGTLGNALFLGAGLGNLLLTRLLGR